MQNYVEPLQPDRIYWPYKQRMFLSINSALAELIEGEWPWKALDALYVKSSFQGFLKVRKDTETHYL